MIEDSTADSTFPVAQVQPGPPCWRKRQISTHVSFGETLVRQHEVDGWKQSTSKRTLKALFVKEHFDENGDKVDETPELQETHIADVSPPIIEPLASADVPTEFEVEETSPTLTLKTDEVTVSDNSVSCTPTNQKPTWLYTGE